MANAEDEILVDGMDSDISDVEEENEATVEIDDDTGPEAGPSEGGVTGTDAEEVTKLINEYRSYESTISLVLILHAMQEKGLA